ncbi:putative flippase GtrA [Alkalihalobacillus xiaoxiensis]|uniref:Flippase GtrA n=1 Tax=Shouchella xiaoxiensis TaxID=766895 RepID=A0ABS2SW58_9BACI|nr:hypothetical protein [Shouchella xiaoxiensis]MBM7839752.1 putative flippase GtrA [Shouchella xiaoxiensis]
MKTALWLTSAFSLTYLFLLLMLDQWLVPLAIIGVIIAVNFAISRLIDWNGTDRMNEDQQGT